jgi:hypothetical protein
MNEISTDTAVSIGLLITIIGATWRLSSLLTEIKLRLDKLKSTPARLQHIENHLMAFEEDINNLWAAVRAGPDASKILGNTRRSQFKPFVEDGD